MSDNETETDRVRDLYFFLKGPGWRWEYAAQIAREYRHGRPAGTDRVVRQILRYLRGQSTKKEKRRIERVQKLNEDERVGPELRARVLARQSVEEIAEATGIRVCRVRLFESCFFDVRPALDARDLIMGSVIDSCSVRSPARRIFLRQAYQGGLPVLEYWLSHMPYLGQEHDLETPEGRQREQLELSILSMELEEHTGGPVEWYVRLVPEMDAQARHQPRSTARAAFESYIAQWHRQALLAELDAARKSENTIADRQAVRAG